MTGTLGRRATAEALGTAALAAVVVGSGIQAAGLSRDVGVQLLANSLATVLGLGVLITLFGPVSGAHFNPVVTLPLLVHAPAPLKEVGAYVGAQTAGAIVTTGRAFTDTFAGIAPSPVAASSLFNCGVSGQRRSSCRASPRASRPGSSPPPRRSPRSARS
ncbi:aquaporin [Lentzea sp. NBRC 102530]|uniref:aquaporin n=1 Tax=Lentzea sp. NBRC 102530 TaxID=3032201 RepID=UPI0024A4912A|nr:aquaporin [Lentzea sp. NBRC 102530]GLY52771.1 hypothetical protein Lesp01_64270 [Lentzea sp. NBRC 102530]